ncbi:hypothetical protein LCGC14_0730780 [marine sediment metagenome]|uniref:Uncharacterized protein n=1 Tax=marine sediment metagenome TaxID=412755 RepID=A0A0F9QDQ1_9ZZZZ
MLEARRFNRNIVLSGSLDDFREATGDPEATTLLEMVETIEAIWDTDDVDWSTRIISVFATPTQWAENLGEPEIGNSFPRVLNAMRDTWRAEVL